MARCATTALAGAVPCLCVRGAGGRSRGFGPVPVFVSSPVPPSRPAFPAVRVAGRPVQVSLTLARWYAISCGLCVPRAPSGCPSRNGRMPLACVCAGALAASAPFPPPWVAVACAPRLVPVQGAGRALPCGPCPSAFPASVPCPICCLWGGCGLVPFPLCLAWGRLPPCGRACASGAVRRRRGRGRRPVCCPPRHPGAWPGGHEERGVALPRSVPLPSLGGHQSGCHQRRPVHGGRGLHTAPVRVCVLTLGVVRGAALCAGTVPPACRGHCESKRMAAWGRVAYALSGFLPLAPLLSLEGEGGDLPCPWGGKEGRRPRGPSPASRGPQGGEWGREGGGGRAAVPRHPPPVPHHRTPGGYGGLACSPKPWPPLVAGGVAPRIPPYRVLGQGCLAAPGAGRGLAGRWGIRLARGGGGRSLRRSSSRARPGWAQGGRGAGGYSASFCLSPPAGRASRRAAPSLPCSPPLHWLASACRRPDAVCGVPLRIGAGLLACRGYHGSGWASDWGHAAYSCAYSGSDAPPWVPWPSRGGGGLPLARRGVFGAPIPLTGLWLSVGWGGGEGGGGEGGGLPAVPLRSPGAALRWLRGGGLMVSAPGGQLLTGGGGALPSCFPSTHKGARLSIGPSPSGPPLLSLLLPRRGAPAGGGGGGGLAGAGGGGWGQRLVVSGLRVSGVPALRASACSRLASSPLQGAAHVLPPCERRGGGGGGALGWGARACRGVVPRRWSSPTPLCPPPRTIAALCSRHLRRRLCGGYGCGGGGFLWP